MNSVIGQMLRCLIHEMSSVKKWKNLLPLVELAINSSVNRSTGYTPFFITYGFDPVVPADLLKGDQQVQLESVNQFCSRFKDTWELHKQI